MCTSAWGTAAERIQRRHIFNTHPEITPLHSPLLLLLHAAGIATCVVPVYIAEVAPFASRGSLACLIQITTVSGILAAQESVVAVPLANFFLSASCQGAPKPPLMLPALGG